MAEIFSIYNLFEPQNIIWTPIRQRGAIMIYILFVHLRGHFASELYDTVSITLRDTPLPKQRCPLLLHDKSNTQLNELMHYNLINQIYSLK